MPYHSPKLHPGPCNGHAAADRQTERHTYAHTDRHKTHRHTDA